MLCVDNSAACVCAYEMRDASAQAGKAKIKRK